MVRLAWLGLVLLGTVAFAAGNHERQASGRTRYVGYDFGSVNPPAGIYTKSNDPTRKRVGSESELHDLVAEEHPWYCKKDPGVNLHQLGADGLRAYSEKQLATYRAQYEPAAAKQFEKASASADVTRSMFRIAREFRFTLTGDRAARNALSLLIDNGRFRLAGIYFESFLSDRAAKLKPCANSDDKSCRERQAEACEQETQSLVLGLLAFLSDNESGKADRVKEVMKGCGVTTVEMAGEKLSLGGVTERYLNPQPKPIHWVAERDVLREVLTYANPSQIPFELWHLPASSFCEFYASLSFEDTATLAAQTTDDVAQRKYRAAFLDRLSGALPEIAPEKVGALGRYLHARLAARESTDAERHLAADLLAALPVEPQPDLLLKGLASQNQEVYFGSLSALERLGEKAVPYLMRALDQYHGEESSKPSIIAQRLGKLAKLFPTTFPTFVKWMGEANYELPGLDTIFSVLGKTSEENTRAIRPLLTHASAIVRLNAVVASKVVPHDLKEDLLARLKDTDRSVRVNALQALFIIAGEKKDRAVLKPLVLLLNDPDELVRLNVEAMLRAVRWEGGQSELVALWAGDEPKVVEALASHFLNPDKNPELVSKAFELLGHEKKEKRERAENLLKQLHPSVTADAVTKALRNAKTSEARRAWTRLADQPDSNAPAAVPALVERLRDSDPTVSEVALYTLGMMMSEKQAVDLLPTLLGILQDTKSTSSMRFHAASALGKAGAQKQLREPLLKLFESEKELGVLTELGWSLSKISQEPEDYKKIVTTLLPHTMSYEARTLLRSRHKYTLPAVEAMLAENPSDLGLAVMRNYILQATKKPELTR